MTKIAVVILNYNGVAFLEKFLHSVLENSQEAQVYVVDNASQDHSLEFIENHFSTVKLIKFSQNYGFTGAYNRALANIQATYFVLLNSDVAVTKGWLQPLLNFLEKNPKYVAVQPKILDYYHKIKFEYAGAAGGYVDILGYPYCRGRVFDTIEKDNGQYDDPTEVDWASGACLMIRSKVFFEVGKFDEDFFAHMEEIDLCWRIKAHNYKIAYVPHSTIYHVGGGTLAKTSPFKTYLNYRNGLFMLIKNLPTEQLPFKLFFRIILDWLSIIKYLLDNNPTMVQPILKAHISVIKKFFRVFKKRGSTHLNLRRKFIVWEYFIKGNKTYKNIHK